MVQWVWMTAAVRDLGVVEEVQVVENASAVFCAAAIPFQF